ncbi:glycosyltransferase family 4 protein [Salinicola corii]|uniref:Glycosyltransferase family 4 protein n=1 Tax=Salinicola corii TaxID=2606937 RepID=A0A640WC34_9GAMM|nr:glycosyltransferase family 4 protein [Salinicola corii]KAA0017903.1 glycosyltransferase family 4 protein [Salinicola corii]
MSFSKLPLSIVQIVRDIGPSGGINGVAYNLDIQFKRKGVEAQAFTLGKVKKESMAKSVFFSKIKLMKEVVQFTVFGTFRARKQFLKSNDQSVVLCHADVLYGDVYVNHGLHLAMLRRSKNRFRIIVRNPFHLFLLLREWLRFYFNIHSVIVCFSDREKLELLEVYPKIKSEVAVIPNGIDLDIYRPGPPQDNCNLRLSFGLGLEDLCLVFVGHEFDRKGLKFVIEALALLPNHVKLVVVGGGSQSKIEQYKKIAEKLAVENRVKFLGQRSDVASLLNMCDLFVLPSFYETWALVGVESMACGLPVLMCPVGGITEYLHDGHNGFEITRDSKDIAEKVKHFINNPSAMNSMGEKAISTAKKYAWSSVADSYIALFRKIGCDKRNRANRE